MASHNEIKNKISAIEDYSICTIAEMIVDLEADLAAANAEIERLENALAEAEARDG